MQGKEEAWDGFGEEDKMSGKRLDEREGKLKGREDGDVNGDCGEGRHGGREGGRWGREGLRGKGGGLISRV